MVQNSVMSGLIKVNNTDLNVSALCLGGNVFGWTADEAQSHEVIGAFVDAGGNFIDTADVYSEWAPGNQGGESESVIGNWAVKTGRRADLVIATKVSKLSSRPGLSASNIIAAAEDSLRRLNTDYIDLYYAHADDPEVSLVETLTAFDSLVKAGKVRYVAASNYTGARLKEALAVSKDLGLTSYVALQNEYNLVSRFDYESDVAPVLAETGLQGIPYFSLAAGFLTGKYQPGVAVDSQRAEGASGYANEKSYRVLAVVESLAASRQVSPAAIALAWLRAQPTVAVPIASARTVEQLKSIMVEVELDANELMALDDAGV
jgi:aryl-alcohol dehydrogenase-like predicted oxidoreductase